MLERPDIQLQAQKEIDRVVGTDRLPSYSDRESLPYVDAIMTEVLRLRPPINAGEFRRPQQSNRHTQKLRRLTRANACRTVTRTPSQDDVHEGRLIEKDAIVIINFW